MTRQDFQLIADTLSNAPVDEKVKAKIIHHFSIILKAAYPKFDPEVFWLRAVKEQ